MTDIKRRTILKALLMSVFATGCGYQAGNPTLTATAPPTTGTPTADVEATHEVLPTNTPEATVTEEPTILPQSSVNTFATGTLHSLALLENGQVLGWGQPLAFGIDGTDTIYSPILLPWRDIKGVYVNEAHSILIDRQGKIQLVGGFEFDVPQIDRVHQVVTSQYYSVLVALVEDGSVWAVGSGELGQLGNGTLEASEEFIQVPVNETKQLAISKALICAVVNDGSVWYWGHDPTITYPLIPPVPEEIYSTPVKLEGVENVVQIALGDGMTMLHEDGTVTAWVEGKLLSVKGIPPLTKIDGYNDSYTLGVGKDGSLWVWGSSWTMAQPASDDIEIDEEDRFVGKQLNLSNIIDIAAEHAILALDNTGTLWGWGLNQSGEVGVGSEERVIVEPQIVFPSG